MTQPQDPMHELLREEFSVLRATVHDELAAMRADLNGLAGEVRGHIPRIAVLEHRADGHDRETQAIKRERVRDQADARADRRWSTSLRITATLGVLAILATLVIGIINLTQGA